MCSRSQGSVTDCQILIIYIYLCMMSPLETNTMSGEYIDYLHIYIFYIWHHYSKRRHLNYIIFVPSTDGFKMEIGMLSSGGKWHTQCWVQVNKSSHKIVQKRMGNEVLVSSVNGQLFCHDWKAYKEWSNRPDPVKCSPFFYIEITRYRYGIVSEVDPWWRWLFHESLRMDCFHCSSNPGSEQAIESLQTCQTLLDLLAGIEKRLSDE